MLKKKVTQIVPGTIKVRLPNLVRNRVHREIIIVTTVLSVYKYVKPHLNAVINFTLFPRVIGVFWDINCYYSTDIRFFRYFLLWLFFRPTFKIHIIYTTIILV